MRNSDFRKLQIWQVGKSICVDSYKLTSTFPQDEKFGMISQIRRAALSVPSNIAEGHARSSDADFVRFLYMCLGSIRELETLFEIATELEFMKNCEVEISKLQQLAKMISSLIKTLKG